MIITFNWLREYLKTNLTAQEIIKNLENLGLNLKNSYMNTSLWDEIEIVKIIKKNKHPNADKLNLYTIEKKNKETTEIVCADQALQVGNYAPYAKPGIIMHNGKKLKISKIRGIESYGMLCSASEINLPIELHSVLRCFEQDFGKTIANAYEKEGIFEIELTPNRGDALSIRGVARILANENFGDFIDHPATILNAPNKTFFEIDSLNCKALYCILFEHKITNTQYNIVKRLQLTKHTVTNLDVVDYTNYISHEIGQPMHVFDYDKIKDGTCTLTELKQNQKYITLSQKEIELEKNSLVFMSNNIVISWASIIGGENSKVDQNTKNILLETGVFTNLDSVQRRKHMIHTSSAKKAEYGLDPTICEFAAHKFLNLTKEKPIFIQNKPFNHSKKINFKFSKIKEILGPDNEEEFKKNMQKKNFIFNDDNTITPPGYKFFNIESENCIIEEYAVGMYEKLKSINLEAKYIKNNFKENKISKIALNEGFNECKNISLGKENKEFNSSLEGRKISNYSNLNYSTLRASLIPDLLKNLSWHINNKYKIYNFFEIGLIYGNNFINKQTQIFTAISINSQKIRKLLTKILSEYEILEKTHSKYQETNYSTNSFNFYCENVQIAKISTINQSILKPYNILECHSLEIFIKNIEKFKIIEKKEIFDQAPIYKDITITIKPEISAEKFLNYFKNKKYDFNILSIYPENNINIERKITLQFKIQANETKNKTQITDIIQKIEGEIAKLN